MRAAPFALLMKRSTVLVCAPVLLSAAFGTLKAETAADQLSLGVRQLREGSAFAAVRTLRQAVKRGDARAHLALASAYFVLNQHSLFAGEIAAAKAAFPADAEPYYVEGRYLFQTEGRAEAAAAQFQHALALDPEHLKAQYYLGVAFRSMQNGSEAERHLVKAIGLAETRKIPFYLPYQTLAEHLLELGRADDAERNIRAAVKMAPEIALNHFLLGKIALAQSNAPGAIAALRTTIVLDEAFLEARYLLSRILQQQGDAAGSKQQLAEFTKLKEIYGAGRLR